MVYAGIIVATTHPLRAHAPSGAIFTTLQDGSEVNFNHFPFKEAVYLDGGPGIGAPQTAAGLDDGTYVFQVTDPSGKTLLSQDLGRCRQFTVAAGIISGVVAQPDGCEHLTGLDLDHGATTVQLFPYRNTPNNGGVYKVWATRVEDFLLGCAQLGVANGLNVVDCGNKTGDNAHGFIPAHSKTDNFKVKDPAPPVEIDTRFFYDLNGNGHKDGAEAWVDGLKAKWTDPLGGSNTKWSYYAPALNVYHEAHVEGVEQGAHKITIEDQTGCTVGLVHVDNIDQAVGPQTVTINIPKTRNKTLTIWVDVACVVNP
jgi:hypothetical protein